MMHHFVLTILNMGFTFSLETVTVVTFALIFHLINILEFHLWRLVLGNFESYELISRP